MVKTPLYPKYSTTTVLLKLLNGQSVSQFKSMWNSIWNLRGTPQNTVDWTQPDQWIEERLEGADKAMALHIWNGSRKAVNPRWTRGDQFLISGYELIGEDNGVYQLNQRGKTFLKGAENEIAREIDEEEGLLQLLLQASKVGRGKRSDFLKDWADYLLTNSNVKEESVRKDYLRRRLVNLWDRGYLSREGNIYEITASGQTYLTTTSKRNNNPTVSKVALLTQEIDQFKREQRKQLREYLEQITPVQFEQLVHDLLVAMGYDEILVTSPTNDKGVDVTAVSQQGITTVKEVIQVKRFTKTNVQRTVLDSLRGSLHRFDAFQGTIITLSDFAKGAKEAAFEKGAAPITLINGEKLIDMLIDAELVIKKKTFDYFIVNEEYFKNQGEEEIE